MENPYESPPDCAPDPVELSLQQTQKSEYRLSQTPNCPFCHLAVSRWSLWNRLNIHRCPQCQARLWLELPQFAQIGFFLAAVLVIPIIVVLDNTLWMLKVPAFGLLALMAIVIMTFVRFGWGTIAGVKMSQ